MGTKLEPAQNSNAFKRTVGIVMACLNGRNCVCISVRFVNYEEILPDKVYICISILQAQMSK